LKTSQRLEEMMSLKYKIASRGEVPTEHQSLYVERDGAWWLDVEGVVEKGRLDEFRANNIVLQKKMNDLEARFAGIDPEEVRKLDAEKKRLEEEAARKNGDLDKVLAARLKPVQEQLQALNIERDALNARLADLQINQAAVAAATKRGLKPTALPDLTFRARQIFRLENGVSKAFEADGRTPRVGKDGLTPMTFDEWAEALVAEAPHLFEQNSGGGAAGNGSGGVGGTDNPWKSGTFNLTKQGQIMKSDPARARLLMIAAGARV